MSEITKFVRAWNVGVTLSEVNNQMRFDKPLSWWHNFESEIKYLKQSEFKYIKTNRSLDVTSSEVHTQLGQNKEKRQT